MCSEFLTTVNTKQARKTNPKCTFRTDILSGGEEPTVTAHLGMLQSLFLNSQLNEFLHLTENGKKIIFKTANLNTLELLQHFNKFSVDFSPEE